MSRLTLPGRAFPYAAALALLMAPALALSQTDVTLSQDYVLKAEGSTVTYTVDLGAAAAVTMSWAVERTGVGAGHAVAADFSAATRGTIIIADTARAVFRLGIRSDGITEPRESFRVRLSALEAAPGFRLDAASSAVESIIAASGGIDYDANDDGLIEISTASQLSAIRYDLRGRGLRGVGALDAAAYQAAFADLDEGETCLNTCAGYELVNDLDLSSAGNWTPIGGNVNESLALINIGRYRGPAADRTYHGTFEGNGYVISNMRINVGGAIRSVLGLFGALGSGGIIRNVGLVDAKMNTSGRDFRTNRFTGALVGWNGGTVAASYAVGDEQLRGDQRGAGLVGGNHGTVIASYADVTVIGRDNSGNSGFVAVVVGSGRVQSSYSLSRDANGCSHGLAGTIFGGAVRGSYFAGDRCPGGSGSPGSVRNTLVGLRAPTAAAGIYAGWDRLNVDNVDQGNDGDFNDDSPWDFGDGLNFPVLRGVSARFPAGNSTNIRTQRRRQPLAFARLLREGGAVGVSEGSRATYRVDLGGRTDSEVRVNWSVELTGAGQGHADASDFIGATRGTVTIINAASSFFTVRAVQDGASERRERFRVGLRNLRGPPHLRLSATTAVESAIEASDGTDYDADGDDLIEVRTPAQLQAIRYDLGGRGLAGVDDEDRTAYEEAFSFFDVRETCAHECLGYELSNDLDLSSVGNWTPLGGGGNPRAYYTAVFEGNGYVVSNLRIDEASLDNAGLFGALGGAGTIRNVGLRDVGVSVRGGSHTGALVGRNEGTVAASYAAGGSVRGNRGVGGLVGANHDTVIASYADVRVHANAHRSGGLIGRAIAGSVVSASYSVGLVTGGADGGRTISGGLSGGRDATGAAGYDVQASYFDSERSGQASCCGANAPSPDAAPRRSFQLRFPTAAAGIYAGWDRLNVDGVDQGDDGDFNDDAPWDFGTSLDYPALRGVSGNFPEGNRVAVASQRQGQPPVLVSLSRRTARITEGSLVTYAVEAGAHSADPIMVSWSVEATGAGAGHAAASDFVVATRGTVVLVDTARAIFQVRIAQDEVREARERFRVRLSDLQASDGVRLSAVASAVVSIIATSDGINYDADGDDLIEVATTSQLAAIRYDLGGRGSPGVDAADETAYLAAFPFFDEELTCLNTCAGYELSNDLDLSSVKLPPFSDWIPIGGAAGGNEPPANGRYQAVFEGNGYVLSNMRIARTSGVHRHMGLFGALGRRGVIRNVGLVDVTVNISASLNTGALVGTSYGRIAASYVAGGSVRSEWVSGGLVGRLVGDAVVIASYADVDVVIQQWAVGGLAGSMNDTSIVSASYTIGETVAGSNLIGGLIGERNDGTPRIQASYYDERSGLSSCCGRDAPSPDETPRTSFQLRDPTTAVGIYAGWGRLNVDGVDQGNDGDLNDDSPWDFGSGFQYPALRGVSGNFPAGNGTGTLVQQQRQPPVLVALSQRAARAAEGSAAAYTVELVEHSAGAVTMSWAVELIGVGAGHAAASDFIGATRGTVVIAGTASAVFGVGLARDGLIEPEERFRVQLSGLEASGGILLSVASSAVESVIAASGGIDYDADDDDLIEVSTVAQLEAVGYDLDGDGVPVQARASSYSAAFPSMDGGETCLNTCAGYELSNDLDLAGVKPDPDAGWTPIGGGGDSLSGRYYTAVFEGNGYVVSNLRVDRSGRLSHTGLFGAVGAAGIIRNVGLRDARISVSNHSSYIGALVGRNEGTVAASYVQGGRIAGVWATGGLVGGNFDNGKVVASYAAVAAHGAGGNVGGLIGETSNMSVVSASYSIGRVTGGGNLGGLIGNRASGAVQSSYFDEGRSGVSGCCGTNVLSPDMTPRTSAELRIPTTAAGIYAAWDRLNVDGVDQGNDGDFHDDNPWDFGSGLDYPVLRGVSGNFPAGNSTSILVQRHRQPPVLVSLVQRDARVVAGTPAAYAAELAGFSVAAVTMTWAVELTTDTDARNAAVADFSDTANANPSGDVATGTVTIVGAASAIFRVGIARNETPEPRERFRVRLKDLQGPDNFRLSLAGSSVVSFIAADDGTADYDLDDDNLIEVATTSQLSAIRYDLGGRGLLGVAAADETNYLNAFPSFGESATCPGPDGCLGYELSNDLDLSSVKLPPFSDWIPIGGAAGGNEPPANGRYQAVFEGNGYVLSNMTIARTSGVHRHMGLFGALGRRGVIRNVGLVDVNVNISAGSLNTGALVGTSYGRIAASYVAGGSVRSQRVSGGLVGRLDHNAVVIASYADVDVTITANAAGGLVGSMNRASMVSASYASGREVAGNARIGGLTGERNGNAASIQASYYDRERSGLSSCCGANPPPSDHETSRTQAQLRTPTTAVGIYAGWDRLDVDGVDQNGDGDFHDDAPWDFGSIYDYPALRAVSGNFPAGNVTAVRTQRNRHAPISVALSRRGTGLIAEGSTLTLVVESAVRAPDPIAVDWFVEATGVGAGYADAADFSAPTRGTITFAGTTSAVFGVAVERDGRSEPREGFRVRLSDLQAPDNFRLSTATVGSVIAASGGMDYDADDDNLIEVATTSQLSAIRYDLRGRGVPGVADADMAAYRAAFPAMDEGETCLHTCAGYELAHDLDLQTYNALPIGGYTRFSRVPANARYEAVFDGNGYVLENLRMFLSGFRSNLGLFGALGASGVIRSVGLVNVDVRREDLNQSSYMGALVGTSYGTIATSYATSGTVSTRWNTAGGLVGRLGGDAVLIASYANVDVFAGIDDAGGLVGSMERAATIIASYAVGETHANSPFSPFIGGLAGDYRRQYGGIRRSYFDREHSGLLSCCGRNSQLDESARTSVELRVPTTAVGIYAGWNRLDLDGVDQGNDGDFNDDAPWDFGGVLDYPVLAFGAATDGRAARRALQREAQAIATLTPTFSGDELVSEGDSAIYRVALDQALPAGVSASWSWSVQGYRRVSAGDFAGTTGGRVVIAAGASSASFPLRVADDRVPELAEVFDVSLGDARFAGAFGRTSASLPANVVRTRIAANGLRQITVTAPETVSEGATATFTVSLGAGAGDDAVVVAYEIDAISEGLRVEELESVTVADRGRVASTRVSSLPIVGRLTMGADGTARVSVRIAPDDVQGESLERFRMRLTYCENCGGVYAAEIGDPSFAEVGILKTPLVVSAQVYLGGAYDAASRAMRTGLLEDLPRRQPYGMAPWNHAAATSVPPVSGMPGLSGVTSTIVDWVLVELRASAPGAGAGASAAVAVPDGVKAGLLLRDGRIAGINEDAPTAAQALLLDGVRVAAEFAPGSELYVLVHHRNHLPVMWAQASPSAACGGADYCADFRARQSYAGCAQLYADGMYMMAAGDTNRSGVVSWGDDDLILNAPVSEGYVLGDLDFDGQASVADVRLILANSLLSSQCHPPP